MKQWIGMLILVLLGSAQATTGSFVGKVQGSEAFIAFVAKDSKVLAYLCDGSKLADWFRLVHDSSGAVEGRSSGGVQLQAKIGAQEIKGTVTLADGKALEFSAAPISGEAGLYRTESRIGGTDYLGGWIVDQQGQQRGALVGGGNLSAVALPISTAPVSGDAAKDSKLCPGIASPKARTLAFNSANLVAWLVTPECADKAIG